MENGTLCHFTRAGETDIFIGRIFEQPKTNGPKEWGCVKPTPRYGVEYVSNGLIIRCYVQPNAIIPYEGVRK